MPTPTDTDEPPVIPGLEGDPALTEDDTVEWTVENIDSHPDVVTCPGCGATLLDADHEHADLFDEAYGSDALDQYGHGACRPCAESLIVDAIRFCTGCGDDHIDLADLYSRHQNIRDLAVDLIDHEDHPHGFTTVVDQTYISDTGNTYCDPYIENASCYECGSYSVDSDDVYMTLDRDGDVMCYSCREGSNGLDSYDHVPDLRFRRVDGPGTSIAETYRTKQTGTPYLGLEVEFEGAAHKIRDIRDLFTDWPDLVWFMHDGSLDESGVELATHPATFEWLDQHFPWDTFARIAKLGGKSYRSSRSGIHVHISADAFTHAHLFKFLAFHYRNPTICQAIGQRGTADYCSWSDWLATRPEIVKYAKKQDSPHTRYMAVNLTESETIELRYFKGNLNPARIRKNIQWVQAVFEYTKTVRAVDVDEGLTFTAMLPWLKERRTRFPDLVDFIENRDMVSRAGIDQHDDGDL